jgi:hypothetical protein
MDKICVVFQDNRDWPITGRINKSSIVIPLTGDQKAMLSPLPKGVEIIDVVLVIDKKPE